MNPNIEPTNQGHRILILALTILLTAGAVGGGVYYVLNQQNEKQNKLIDELQKAEKDDATTGKTVLKIKELGIQIKLPSTISDATYTIGEGGNTSAFFTTKRLISLDSINCSGESEASRGPIGVISVARSKEANTYGEFIKQVADDKFVYYISPQAPCGDGEKVQAALALGIDGLKEAVKSVTAISESADETAEWETYEDKAYGYSFKYPKSIKLDYTKDDTISYLLKYVGISNQESLSLGVSVFENKRDLSVKDWILEKDSPSNYVSGLKEANIGDGTGYYYLEAGIVDFYSYAVKLKGGQILHITTMKEDSQFKSTLNTFNINE